MWTSSCRPRTPRPASFPTRRTGLLWLQTYRTIAQCSRAYAGGGLREDEITWQANAEPLVSEAWCLCLFHVLMRRKGGMIKNVYTHGQSRDKPIYNRSNLQQDEFESTNIIINILTEVLMFFVLSCGVSCSKGCCRRFGRISGKCRAFERSNNILTEMLLMISNTRGRHVEQLSNYIGPYSPRV